MDGDGHGEPGRRLLVWGIDGAVVGSYQAVRVAVDAALGSHDLQPANPSGTKETVLRSLVGLSLDRLFRRVVAHRAPDAQLIDSLVAAYRAAFRSAAPQHARLVPGIAPLLARLRDQGAVSVAASSDRSGTELLLDSFGIADLFSGVVSDDDVERHQRKPHPEMVSVARRRYGFETAETVVIGASVFDLEMGQAAGVSTVGVTWGDHSRGDLSERHPTHLVDDVDELAALLALRRARLRPRGGAALACTALSGRAFIPAAPWRGTASL